MKKLITILIPILIIGFIFSKCSSVDLSDKKAVKSHLMEFTFEYVDYKNNLTSFIQFYENSCRLTIFLNGKKASEEDYSYEIEENSSDRVDIHIPENSGEWNLKKDGDIYMYNKGELFIYHHKKI